MKLDPVSILQEIIDRDGECDDLDTPAVCKFCPLGNKRIDGRRVSCMDYLKIKQEMTDEQASEIYKKAAEDELFTIELEDFLSEN